MARRRPALRFRCPVREIALRAPVYREPEFGATRVVLIPLGFQPLDRRI